VTFLFPVLSHIPSPNSTASSSKRICNICNICRTLQHNIIYLVSYCSYEWTLFIYSTRDLYFCDKLYLLFFFDKKVHFLALFLSSSYLTPNRKYKIDINYGFEQAHNIYGMIPVIGYGMSIWNTMPWQDWCDWISLCIQLHGMAISFNYELVHLSLHFMFICYLLFFICSFHTQ
jgi:hypothetical protein